MQCFGTLRDKERSRSFTRPFFIRTVTSVIRVRFPVGVQLIFRASNSVTINLMERSKTVLAEVDKLYATATTTMGKWMWRNHTQWVADKGKELARKYKADEEKAYCAALLHDLGDSKYERGDENFDTWAIEKSKAILHNATFSDSDTNEILEAVRTHSSRPGNLPATIEGKVLATADAMWHLQTNFFPVICYMNRPQNTHSYEEWQDWFDGKIERDFGAKIFFDDEREEVREDYEALTRVFRNKTLDTRD
jgi:HD superfamily phosphodiesterase